MFLQTADAFRFAHVIGYVPCWHKTRYVTFALHISDLTGLSWGRGDGGGVTDKRAAKPVTAVQDCVSKFVSVTLTRKTRSFPNPNQVVFETKP